MALAGNTMYWIVVSRRLARAGAAFVITLNPDACPLDPQCNEQCSSKTRWAGSVHCGTEVPGRCTWSWYLVAVPSAVARGLEASNTGFDLGCRVDSDLSPTGKGSGLVKFQASQASLVA